MGLPKGRKKVRVSRRKKESAIQSLGRRIPVLVRGVVHQRPLLLAKLGERRAKNALTRASKKVARASAELDEARKRNRAPSVIAEHAEVLEQLQKECDATEDAYDAAVKRLWEMQRKYPSTSK